MNMNTGEELGVRSQELGDFHASRLTPPASRLLRRVASPAISEFAKTMAPRANRASSRRMNLDAEKKKNGLAQLVLTVVKLLHELLEKQAIRRIDGGGLTDEEIERLGFTLMRQSEEIAKIAREFGLESDDLNLDLGPLGKLL
ncbi:MAG: gas vesicle protein K [Pseudomonadota bacterium]